MDSLHIAVCEDRPEDAKLLLSIIAKTGIASDCEAFSNGEAFLQSFRAGKYDAVFMDIYMGSLTGVSTVTELRRVDDAVPVAFTTTSRDFTLEGYRLDVLKYLEKPVNEKDVLDFLRLAQLKREDMPRLSVKQGGSELSVLFSRILFAEQRGHELLLRLTGGEALYLTDRLDILEPEFAGQSFLRCHKSYLVNLSHVEALDRELRVFTMDDGSNVHIRRESMSAARKAYEEYLFGEARRSAHDHE